MVGYEFEHSFDSGWKFSQTARYGHVYSHSGGPYLYGYYDPLLAPSLRRPHRLPVDRLAYTRHRRSTASASIIACRARLKRRALDHQLRSASITSITASTTYRHRRPQHRSSATNPVMVCPGCQQFLQQSADHAAADRPYAQDQIRFGDGWLLTFNGAMITWNPHLQRPHLLGACSVLHL